MNTFTSSFGHFNLQRFPVKEKETLRAWDAADEYILAHLTEINLLTEGSRPLIINDGFGALSTALASYQPQSQSDSYISHAATRYNLESNHINTANVSLLTSLEQPQSPFNLVIIKAPKSLAMLEDQLHRLKPFIDKKTYILGAAMAKNIHNSTLKLFETILGKTTTSLAKKKARLIFCKPDLELLAKPTPYPARYTIEKHPATLIKHANVFSQNSLDIGTRFFIDNLPTSDSTKSIVDLGCGDGVVGIIAAKNHPNAKLFFLDESFMAVESAKINFQSAYPNRDGEFVVTDCLQGLEKTSVDLILNNPPFHQQHAVGDHIAWQMFKESLKTLKKDGELWVIGNRHLNYHIKLKRLFGNCTTVASNNKFAIFKSTKQT